MRTGTILVLLGLILMVAFFGWKVLTAIALTILIFLLLAVAAVVGGLWYIRRRMERKVVEIAKALSGERGGSMQPPARGDVIDVEATVRKPRDGADDPDLLDPSQR